MNHRALVAGCFLAVCAGAGAACSGEVARPGAEDLDEFCEDLGRRFCDQDEPCCKRLGFEYDETACRKWFTDACNEGAEVVRRGDAEFHPEAFESCIADLQPFYDKCELDHDEWLQYQMAGVPCWKYFVGLEPQGSPCTVQAECDPGGGVAFCSGEGVCVTVDPGSHPSPGKGQSCPNDFCDQVLVCDSGVCVDGPKRPVVTAEECNGTTVIHR
jgi:hypothetical protein